MTRFYGKDLFGDESNVSPQLRSRRHPDAAALGHASSGCAYQNLCRRNRTAPKTEYAAVSCGQRAAKVKVAASGAAVRCGQQAAKVEGGCHYVGVHCQLAAAASWGQVPAKLYKDDEAKEDEYHEDNRHKQDAGKGGKRCFATPPPHGHAACVLYLSTPPPWTRVRAPPPPTR